MKIYDVLIFKEQPISKVFDNLNIPGWKIISFKDKDKYTSKFYLQVNVKKHKGSNEIYNFIHQTGKPFLVLETSLFRKNTENHRPEEKLKRLGWFHYLRQGNFNNHNSPSDRWNYIKEKQQIDIQPWNPRGEDVLLILQKDNDSSLNSLYLTYPDYSSWIEDTILRIQKITNRNIIIRPHIKTKVNLKKFESSKVRISNNLQRNVSEGGTSLINDFNKSFAVVGYTSNALIESVCEGLPTYPLSEESVAYDVGNRLENLETPDLTIDRSQWLYNCAYMIWTKEELNNGIAWNHLKSVF